MQLEILKFLMDANTHFKELRGQPDRPPDDATGVATDLQAVERVLPDCDWFELSEPPRRAARKDDELWMQPGPSLAF